MAFDLNSLSSIGGSSQSPVFYTYLTTDSKVTVLAANYFDEGSPRFRKDDFIFVVLTNSTFTVRVTTIGVNSVAIRNEPISNSVVRTLFAQTADKTVANTTAETSLVGTGTGSLIIPANEGIIGTTFRLRLEGIVSNTGNPSFRLKAKTNGTILSDSGSFTFGNVSNDHFVVEGTATLRTLGVNGTISVVASFMTSNGDHIALINTSPVVIDTTINQTFDFSVTWGIANAANTITSQNLIISTD